MMLLQYVGFLLCALVPEVWSIMSTSFCHNESVDCSYQLNIPDLPKNSCMIYNTNICRTMPLSSTYPVNQLESEDGAPFQVDMLPISNPNSDYKVAVNISLRTNNNDVTGLYLFVQQNETNYNSCRVFDFAEVKRLHPSQMVDLNYDCYKGFEAFLSHEYHVIVRASPINKEYHYRTYIPTFQQSFPEDACNWFPLAMLNVEALSRRIVDFKFSPLNTDLNVSASQVLLVTDSSIYAVQQTSPLAPDGKYMHRVIFNSIPSGRFSIAVEPIFSHTKCSFKPIFTVVLPPDTVASHATWYYVLAAVIPLILIMAGAFFLVKWCYKRPIADKRRKAILLYSEDCPEHLDLVMKTYEFLRYYCFLDVSIDRCDMRNCPPSECIPNMLQEAEYIILVVSEGVKHKADMRNDPPMIENSPSGDLFLPAYRWLMHEITYSSVRLVKVVFRSYTNHELIPTRLRRVGVTFNLMSELNRFLCYIHCGSVKSLFHFCSRMPERRYLSCSEGRALQEALNTMIEYQRNDPDWFQKCLPEEYDVPIIP